ncbi:MAG: hypothetical protein KGZ83_21170 [Sulfuricella sp.]|nr:hypothetical protein [Sulfuricella sp.]
MKTGKMLCLVLLVAGAILAPPTALAALSFTSAAGAAFAAGAAGSFTVAAAGAPAPHFSILSGGLPSGVTLAADGTLSGTPAIGSGGSYPLVIVATGSAGSAMQNFTLTVSGAWVTTQAPSDLRYNGEPYDVSYNSNTRQLFPTQGTLNGKVNPNNDTCTVSFEYGPTTAYGSTLGYGDVSGVAPVAVSAHAYFSWIHDYLYDPVLHYRTKAVCATSGTWHGNDITFVPFTSTVRWYTETAGPGSANASFPTLNIHVFAACLDDPTWAAYDIFSNAGYTVTVNYSAGVASPGSYILGDWMYGQIYIPKAAGIVALSYRGTLFNQTVTNDQACAETPSPSVKIRTYALGQADTQAAGGAQVFAIYNDNPAPVTLEVMAVSDIFNVTIPARSRQLIATGLGEAQLSYNATPFQVISPLPDIFWADRYLVTAQPVCTTATTSAFMLSNNSAAPQTAVLRSGSTEHRYDLAAYESRQVTVESGSWDLYLVVPGMAGPRMAGDHVKVATLGNGAACSRTLTVSKSGAGDGTVAATGCTLVWNGASGSCSAADGTSITLSGDVGSNGTFFGWSNGIGSTATCSGTSACTFSLSGDSQLSWGITLEQTPSNTPDAFSFTAATGAALGTATESAAIAVAGIITAANISIVGGQYAVSTDSGGTWGAYTAAAGTVSLNDQAKVKLTSSNSYSTAATATLTIGGVNGAFSVTTLAAPASSYIPPTPAVINAPTNVETTLTGTTPVTAAPGSTLAIPAGANIAGVAIILAAPSGGGAAAPISVKIGGLTLTLSGYTPGTVVSFKKIAINGTDTPVLVVTSGSLSLSAAAGQPLLALNGVATLTAGDNGAAVSFSAGSDGSGDIAVTNGFVVLPANAFAAAGNDFATIQDGKLYAGEIAAFNPAGKITNVRLGSQDGNGGAVGDPLKPTRAANLNDKAVVPNLNGKVARISTTQAFTDLLAATIDPSATSQGQNSDGVLRFAIPGGSVNALPVGSITVDTSRPDGVTLTGTGNAEVVKSGVVTRFAPAVSDFAQFAGQLATLDKNAILSLLEDGRVHLRVNNVTYVLQPAWTVKPSEGPAGFNVNEQANFVYRNGSAGLQILFPAFADLPQLVAVFKALDAAVSVAANGDGTYSAKLLGMNYILTPDYHLTTPSADKAGKGWWKDEGGKLYLRNGDGSAQGFGVK